MNGIQLLLKQNLSVVDALADLFRVLSCMWVDLVFVREAFFAHQTASGAGVIDLLCADPFSPTEFSGIRGDVLEVCSCLHFHVVKLILLKSFWSFPCWLRIEPSGLNFYSAFFAYQCAVTGTCDMPLAAWIFEYGILALFSSFREMAQFFPIHFTRDNTRRMLSLKAVTSSSSTLHKLTERKEKHTLTYRKLEKNLEILEVHLA